MTGTGHQVTLQQRWSVLYWVGTWREDLEELSVRIAGAADAEAISALLFAFNGEALDTVALARRLVEVGETETVFLAGREAEPAGLLVLRTVPTLSGPEDWAEITEMYVREGARRRGVGRTLVEAALDYARRRGCTEVHLLVDPENQPALAFYRALGFCHDSWEMRQRL